MNNEEKHISGAVSALVMLAAVASTWSVYSVYREEQVAVQYEQAQMSLDQTASALISLRQNTITPIESLSTTTEADILQ